jgi:hypothetical protein
VHDMDRELNKTIEKLLKNCPEGCMCRQRGIENLCSAQDVGMEGFVECLEKDPLDCFHPTVFGRAHYCSCPARVYIAKQFKI